MYAVTARAFHLPALILTFSIVAQLLFLVTTTYFVQFTISSLIVASAFWLQNVDGLMHFRDISLLLFSGMMIPIAFMPPWLQSVTQLLPLKYMYAVPVNILQNKYTLQVNDVVYFICFYLVLFLLLKLVWKKGSAKYSSAGG
jgi:ABC-2 type transport system permease protein